jgi:hypothetical protein
LSALLASGALLGSMAVSQAGSAPASAAPTSFYGISLSELQVAPVGMATTEVAEAETQAIHDAWDANTVRLQIAQDKLIGIDGSCKLAATGCLAYYEEVQAVANYALRLGLTVVINDTTLPSPGFTTNEPLPTQATEVFWKDIAAAYAGNPHVIFDLFNEPRGPGGAGAAQWRVWRDGGAVDGSSFLGMQTVLSYIRNTLKAPNMVWADGLNGAGTLNGIAPHAASGTVDGAPGSVGSYALSQAGDAVTGPLVYAFHHPMGNQTITAWRRDFGYLPALGFSVMDGEWNNAVDRTNFCWDDAPTTIPAYLKYLATERIGLTGWELGPQVNSAVGAIGKSVNWSLSTPFNYPNASLADSPASYGTPTTTSGKPAMTWRCSNSNDAGAGQVLHDWFAQQGG